MSRVFALISAVLLTVAFAYAEDEKSGQPAPPDANRIPTITRPTEFPEEMTDMVMARLSREDPNKAKELENLRKENPAKFREEIDKLFQERSTERMRGRRGQPGEGPGGRPGRDQFGIPTVNDADRQAFMNMMRQEPGQGPPPEQPGMPDDMAHRRFGWIADRFEEFPKWLKENYPEDANKLDELQKKNPELFPTTARIIAGKYWQIFEARDNPELVKILKEQLVLNDSQERLLRQISKAANEKEKEALTSRLKEVLNKKYDLIVARKKIAYDWLKKRLEDLQKQVNESQNNVEKWQKPEFKQQQVEERLKELVNKTKTFEWE